MTTNSSIYNTIRTPSGQKKNIQVTATDGDKDREQNIVYFLTGQGIDPDNPANSKFDINRTTGEIYVLKVSGFAFIDPFRLVPEWNAKKGVIDWFFSIEIATGSWSTQRSSPMAFHRFRSGRERWRTCRLRRRPGQFERHQRQCSTFPARRLLGKCHGKRDGWYGRHDDDGSRLRRS